MLYVTSMLTKANLVIIYFRNGSSALIAGAILLSVYYQLSQYLETEMAKSTSYVSYVWN